MIDSETIEALPIQPTGQDIPKCVYQRSGAFYVVKDTKWSFLGRTWEEAKPVYELSIWRRPSVRSKEKHATHNESANTPAKLSKALNQCFWVAQQNAKTRNIPFALTKTQFDKIVRRADGKCEVSGLPFDLRYWEQSKRRPFAPSLDRIDATRAYMKSNCRLVCGITNAAMSDWGIEPLRALVTAMGGRQ